MSNENGCVENRQALREQFDEVDCSSRTVLGFQPATTTRSISLFQVHLQPQRPTLQKPISKVSPRTADSEIGSLKFELPTEKNAEAT